MPTNEGMTVPAQPIAFFDGVCGLCNAIVDFLLRVDTKRVLLFAPLQGETARRALGPMAQEQDVGEDSFVLLDEHGMHERADAVLATCRHLGGPWALIGLAGLLPLELLDQGYRFIARNRYDWFGQRATCRIPTAEERERFLP
jgi:predicted DCC family thiol-disulfide oxidoreductase YuxK